MSVRSLKNQLIPTVIELISTLLSICTAAEAAALTLLHCLSLSSAFASVVGVRSFALPTEVHLKFMTREREASEQASGPPPSHVRVQERRTMARI